jgi:hypothetical protein
MSDDLIARARAALDGVTPGEWSLIADPLEDGFECLRVSAGDACVIAGCGCCGSPFGDNMADASFIAAARSLVPDMADEITRLRAEVERLRGALQRIVSTSQAMSADYICNGGESGHERTARIAFAALTPEASHD